MTNVVNDRLPPGDKKEWLTDDKLAAYRDVIASSGLLQDVDGVVDGEGRKMCHIYFSYFPGLSSDIGSINGAFGAYSHALLTPTATSPLHP